MVEWFSIKNPNQLKGIALMIHGLNLKPERMDSIISYLTECDIAVLNCELRGHGANYVRDLDLSSEKARIESFKSVTYSLWRDEVYGAYQLAKAQSKCSNVPLFLVGYSLGGLMGCELFASNPDVQFERMLLFAPALIIRSWSYILKPLTPFPRIMIPSLSPKEYRANPRTSIAAYNALYTAVEHFQRSISQRVNVPTLLFIDRRDELVSYRGLKRMLTTGRLDQWRICEVGHGQSTNRPSYHHLIIHESLVGRDEWSRMMALSKKHLISSTMKAEQQPRPNCTNGSVPKQEPYHLPENSQSRLLLKELDFGSESLLLPK